MKAFKNLITRHFHVPGSKKLDRIIRSMSPTEWTVFMSAGFLLAISSLFLVGLINFTLIEKVPAPGGNFTEGLIGTPRFINPLLASSDADRSLTSLVYAGLMKINSSGQIVPELADEYSISEDRLSYTFTLRGDAYFHDGIAVSADDVVFTVERAADNRVQSFRQASWSGVSVEKVNEKTVRFTLTEPFANFLENTTIGIIPKHLWEEVEAAQTPFSTLNIEPVGAGPYKVKNIERRESGIPISYTLEPFNEYVLGKPFIQEISFLFYENQESLLNAYKTNKIESLRAISAEDASDIIRGDSAAKRQLLPRIFGIFFNQNNNPALLDKSVREALREAVDKDALIDESLEGFGQKIDSPIPEHIKKGYGMTTVLRSSSASKTREILIDGGWEFDNNKGVWIFEEENDIKELSLTLATPNIPELEKTAQIIARHWREIGVKVDVNSFDGVNLDQEIIRSREYEALLFGMVVANPLDLFAFWHSSQRSDPGLNIASYTNIDVDRALRDLRESEDDSNIKEDLELIEAEILEDVPAVFLYSPEFIYIIPERIKGVELGIISHTGDRFSNVHKWFIETNREWAL